MNEAIELSRLATRLLRQLQDISDDNRIDGDSHVRSIEVILEAFGAVDQLICMRKPETEHIDDADDAVN